MLQIPLEGFSVQQLTNFRQKVTYALNSVPKSDRPDDRLLGEWLFQRLKHCKRLEHEIRTIKNLGPKSPKRLFPWLWRRLRDSLIESKEDDNAAAVDSARKRADQTQQMVPTHKQTTEHCGLSHPRNKQHLQTPVPQHQLLKRRVWLHLQLQKVSLQKRFRTQGP